MLPCRERCYTYHIANDADGITGSHARQPYRQPSGHMHEPSKQRIVFLGRWSYLACDEDGYDERVDSQDTGHDHGDQALANISRTQEARGQTVYLHNQIWPVCAHTRNPNARLCRAIGSSDTCTGQLPRQRAISSSTHIQISSRRSQGLVC
jgi:hypothetical protein